MKRETVLKIPYGKGGLRFSLPPGRLLGVLSRPAIAARDIKDMISASLERSLGKRRLSAKNVLVVVPDSTRSAHLKSVLPAVLAKIRASSSVDIIVATGLHKKHSRRQLKDLLGGEILKRHKVISHDQDERSLEDMGMTSARVPVVLNKSLREHDLVVTLGVVEPHLYAGYSGGAKTVAVGLAGEKTINATHGLRFLDDPRTRLGVLRGNPFQKALWDILKYVSVGFALNIVNGPDGRAVGVFSGDIEKVFRDSVNFSKRIFEIHAPRQADVVICGVGYPKDVNLYQASRAINYVVNVNRPVIRKGGVLIVVAQLADGIGGGLSEKRFYEAMRTMDSPGSFIKKVRESGCIAGTHRAYMVAGAMADYDMAFVTKDRPDIFKGLPFPCFKDAAEAVSYADTLTGRGSKIYVIPRALATIARLNK